MSAALHPSVRCFAPQAELSGSLLLDANVAQIQSPDDSTLQLRLVGVEWAPALIAGWLHEERRGDLGANLAISYDVEGLLHFCYQDGGSDSLYYLAPALGLEEWVDDGVRLDSDGRAHGNHVVGEDCSLLFDSSGRVVLVYQDATAHALVVSRRDEGGSWLRLTLRNGTDRASGFYSRALIDDANQLWVSHYVYDSQRTPAEEYLEVLTEESP